MTDRKVNVFTKRKGRRNDFVEVIGTMSQQESDAVAITGGTITGVVLTDFLETNIEVGVVAAGTIQGDATAVTGNVVVVATTALNTGIVIPAAVAGKVMKVFNQGANALNVFPAGAGMVDGGTALIVAIGGGVSLTAVDATDWFSIG